MNVYWCAAEDIDYAVAGALSTAAGTNDTTYGRVGCGVAAGNGVAWPLNTYVANPASFGNLSSLWFHCGWYLPTAQIANYVAFAFADNAGVGRVLIRATGTQGQLKISTRNAAGTVTDLITSASGLFAASALCKVDIFINYSTSGQITIYINGANILDTGPGVNVTTDGATSLSYVYLGAQQNNASVTYWSEVIVADSDTRAARLWTLNSTTAGNAQTWAGTATNVNKTAINDTTYISAASAGLINEYRSGGIALPVGTFSVATVKMSSRASIGAAGPQHVEYVTRVGSTDYTGGSWSPPSPGTFANDVQNYMQATNPGTGIAWTTSDLTATTFNYGVESVT